MLRVSRNRMPNVYVQMWTIATNFLLDSHMMTARMMCAFQSKIRQIVKTLIYKKHGNLLLLFPTRLFEIR